MMSRVSPERVDEGDITEVTVTYVVKEDMLFGANNIIIGLPSELECRLSSFQ